MYTMELSISRLIAGSLSTMGMLFAFPAFAQPITPASDGTGTIVTPHGHEFLINGGTQAGANLFHSFQQFGLDTNQIATFLATPELQNILSRVVGGDPSVINGLLQVTGGSPNLYLMNPAGIIFGSSASLNVPASFTATTATGIGFGTDNWFTASGSNNYATLLGSPTAFSLESDSPFSRGAGGIVNAGNLAVNAGQSLNVIGSTVVNTGTLSAPGGSITLLSVPGSSLVRLSQPGSLLSLEIATQGQAALSSLSPASLPQLLTGSGLSSPATGLAVEADGTVRLTATNTVIPQQPGTTIVSGAIDGSSPILNSLSSSPYVAILGDRVGLFSSRIAASGSNGGGRVLIGGDLQGRGSVPNAQFTVVDSLSTIAADALQSGDGGKVIIWADNTTRFLGSITARGAEQGLADRSELVGPNPALSASSTSSNGGFVEVSGKQTLLFRGQVDTSAPLGKSGTLLLDPDEITITLGVVGVPTGLDSGNTWGAGFTEPLENPGTQTIGTNDLRSLLLSNNLTLEATGNIAWITGATLDYDGIGATRTLNLVAGNSITIGGTITDTVVGGDSLNVVLNADRDNNGIGAISLLNANIITSGGNIILGGGTDPLLNPAIGANGHGISITNSNLDAGGGNISLRGQSSDAIGVFVQNSTLRTVANGTIVATGVTTSGTDGINTNDSGLITTGAGNITLLGTALTSGTGINLGAINTTTGNITANGIGQGGWGMVVNKPISTIAGNISLRGTNPGSFEGIRVNQPITTTTGTIDLNGASGGSGVWVVDSGQLSSLGGQISVTGSNISIGGRHGVIVDATSGGINSNGGNIFLSGTSVASSTDVTLNQTVTAGSGRIVLSGDRFTISRPLVGFGLGIQAHTSGLDVEIGGSSTFLSSADIAAINTSGIEIGGIVPFGTVTLRTDANFNAITEISDVDTLVGPNRVTQWTITGLGSGEISGFPNRLSFRNVNNIVGGNLGDSFVIGNGAGVTGTINGGAGFDILDYTNYNAPFSVNIALGLATSTGSITNIEDFIPKGSLPSVPGVPGGDSSGGSSSNPLPDNPLPDFIDDFQLSDLDDIEDSDRLLDDPFTDIALDLDFADIQDLPGTDSDLLEIDGDFAADFADHLNTSASDFATDVDAAATLRRVNRETGINSAFVFINFVPSAAPNSSARAKSRSSQLLRPSRSSRSESDRDELELLVATADGKYVRRRLRGVTRKQVIETADRLRLAITEPSSNEYLKPAQALYQWLIAPLESTLEAQNIGHLSLLLAPRLRSVPLAVLHDGKQFIIEKYSIGLMPSLAMTDTTYKNLQNAQVLAMGASKFAEQNPLPAVPEELRLIADDLWPGEAYLNEAFTLANLKTRHRQGNFRIIHLATHGDFKAGDLSQSYIQFWDTRLRLDQIRELSLDNPKVDLLVLSACRTALGSEQAELGFAGLAFQAGVRSVLGSLWYVSDEGTLALMKEFYSRLQVVPIKAEALRQAQLTLIQGKVVIQDGQIRSGNRVIPLPPELVRNEAVSLSHPYYWAAFTLVGNPW